ncbi:MAG TPA: hypothetical protein VGF75_05420 [Candidatus Saccharimonadales bacterium]|jgi:hypothetical protein
MIQKQKLELNSAQDLDISQNMSDHIGPGLEVLGENRYFLEAGTDHESTQIPIGGSMQDETEYLKSLQNCHGNVFCKITSKSPDGSDNLTFFGVVLPRTQAVIFYNVSGLEHVNAGEADVRDFGRSSLSEIAYNSGHRHVIGTSDDMKLGLDVLGRKREDIASSIEETRFGITVLREKPAGGQTEQTDEFYTLQIDAIGKSPIDIQYATNEKQIVEDPALMDVCEMGHYSKEIMQRKASEVAARIHEMPVGQTEDLTLEEITGSKVSYFSAGSFRFVPNLINDAGPNNSRDDLVYETTDNDGYVLLVESLGVIDPPSYMDLLDHGITLKKREFDENGETKVCYYSQLFETSEGKTVALKIVEAFDLSDDETVYRLEVVVSNPESTQLTA